MPEYNNLSITVNIYLNQVPDTKPGETILLHGVTFATSTCDGRNSKPKSINVKVCTEIGFPRIFHFLDLYVLFVAAHFKYIRFTS